MKNIRKWIIKILVFSIVVSIFAFAAYPYAYSQENLVVEKLCPKCGRTSTMDEFCGSDGTQLVVVGGDEKKADRLVCEECFEPALGEWKFCPNDRSRMVLESSLKNNLRYLKEKEIEEEERELQKQQGGSYASAKKAAKARERDNRLTRDSLLLDQRGEYLRCLRLTNQFFSENPGDHPRFGIEGEKDLVTEMKDGVVYRAKRWYQIKYPNSWGPTEGR